MKRARVLVRTVTLALVVAACGMDAVAQEPPPTAFTYQGRLLDDGVPANGSYDFIFAMFNAATSGTQIGTNQIVSGIVVSDGLVSAVVDFGDVPMDDARWLSIAVRATGAGAFFLLSPRLAIHPAPQAHFAVEAQTAVLAETATSAISAVSANSANNANTLDFIDSTGFSLSSHAHSFAQITGSVTDAQVPNTITIDLAANAGLLDGIDSTGFATAAHGHSTLAASDGTPAAAVAIDANGNAAFAGLITLVNNASISNAVNEIIRLASGPNTLDFELGERITVTATSVDGRFALAGAEGALPNGDGTRLDIEAGAGVGTGDGGDLTLTPGAVKGTGAPGIVGVGASELYLDVENEAAGQNVRVIANQGTDPAGMLQYNATTDAWEASSDGGANFDALLLEGTPIADADTLDGIDSTGFAAAAHTHATLQSPSNTARVTLSDTGRVVVGATSNSVVGNNGAVFGGTNNTSQVSATVVGGDNNAAAGTNSVIVGGSSNNTGGTNSVVLGGSGNVVDGNFSVVGGRRAATDAAGTFMWADSTDADFISSQANAFLIRAANGVGINRTTASHPLHVGTDATNGNGAHVTAAGMWTNGSSRAFKEGFRELDARAILEAVARLPIQRWTYRGVPGEEHIGPTAEDFRAAFGLGHSDQYIGTVDADGVALAAIQGLDAKLREMEETARARDAEIERLRTQNAALAERLARLERRLDGRE